MILFFMCKCSTVQNKNNTKFTKQLTKIPNRTRDTKINTQGRRQLITHNKCSKWSTLSKDMILFIELRLTITCDIRYKKTINNHIIMSLFSNILKVDLLSPKRMN